MPQAREAANRALHLDETLAAAHISLGYVKSRTIGTGRAPGGNSDALWNLAPATRMPTSPIA
jgi:hypothetical protein